MAAQFNKKDRLPLAYMESAATAVALCDDEYVDELVKLVSVVNAADFFDEPINNIVTRSLEHREKHGRPPGKQHIDEVFADILEDPKHKFHSLYLKIINGMVRQADGLDTKYVLSWWKEFAATMAVRVGLMKAGDRFNKGGPDMISDVFGITNELPQKVEQAGKPKFLFKPMSDVPIRPVFWLWENRFPEGKLIGICGPEDVGKTILECEIAAILTSKDRCWPDGTKPQYTYDVTMMASEDSYEDTIKPRLLAAGANMDRIRYLDMERNSFSLDKDLSKLEEHLKVYPNNVVFISPLYNFVSDRVRTNDTGNMQRVLGPVSRAADRSGSTVFCNLHFNKNTDARAGDRIMGARGTGASFRAAWGVVVNPDDKDERLLLKISNRLAPSSQPGWRFKIKGKTVEQYDPKSGTTIFARNTAYIEWIEEDDRDIDAVLQERKAGQKQDKAMRFLSDLLADGPVLSTDAEKAVADAKFSESTIKRAKRELGVHSKKQGLVWYWCYRK